MLMKIIDFAERWSARWLKGKALQPGQHGQYFHIDRPSPKSFHLLSARSLTLSGWAFDASTSSVAKVWISVGRKRYIAPAVSRADVQSTFVSVCSLPLECGFEETIELSLGFCLIEIAIEMADKTYVPIYETVVLRVPRLWRSQDRIMKYEDWRRARRKLVELQLPEIRAHIAVMPNQPKFGVIIDATAPGNLTLTMNSLERQIYPRWSAVISGRRDRISTAWIKHPNVRVSEAQVWDTSDADFLVFLKPGDCLEQDALYAFASRLNECEDIDLVYSDEEFIDEQSDGLVPFHKPGWSPDYLETFNYIGRAACFRSTIARECSAPINHYDFVLQFCERARVVHHLDFVLLASRAVDGVREGLDNKAALELRLARTGRHGNVVPGDQQFNYFRISLELRESPLVSIVIPTAGKKVNFEGRQLDLIINCIDQIKKISTYSNVEIIVVDNGDLTAAQLTWLKNAGCRLVTFTEPHFNIAKKLNLGASIAKGKFLLLLNDDIEILTAEWIERMLEQFEKPHVGVVGVKLLYADETTQHVGVVFNYSNPDHVRRLQPRSEYGYYFSTCGVRNYLAVTGACMMTPADIYRTVGGYSEALSVSFNDVDYCLKVRQLGLFSVYTGLCELVHMESQTRHASLNLEELRWFHNAWRKEITFDPFYNERYLSVARPTFEPVVNPRLL